MIVLTFELKRTLNLLLYLLSKIIDLILENVCYNISKLSVSKTDKFFPTFFANPPIIFRKKAPIEKKNQNIKITSIKLNKKNY